MSDGIREQRKGERLAKAQANAQKHCGELSRTDFAKIYCADYQALRRASLVDRYWGPVRADMDDSPQFSFDAIKDFFFDQARALEAHLRLPKGRQFKEF